MSFPPRSPNKPGESSTKGKGKQVEAPLSNPTETSPPKPQNSQNSLAGLHFRKTASNGQPIASTSKATTIEIISSGDESDLQFLPPPQPSPKKSQSSPHKSPSKGNARSSDMEIDELEDGEEDERNSSTTKPNPTTTRPHPTTTRPHPTTTRPNPTTQTQNANANASVATGTSSSPATTLAVSREAVMKLWRQQVPAPVGRLTLDTTPIGGMPALSHIIAMRQELFDLQREAGRDLNRQLNAMQAAATKLAGYARNPGTVICTAGYEVTYYEAFCDTLKIPIFPCTDAMFALFFAMARARTANWQLRTKSTKIGSLRSIVSPANDLWRSDEVFSKLFHFSGSLDAIREFKTTNPSPSKANTPSNASATPAASSQPVASARPVVSSQAVLPSPSSSKPKSTRPPYSEWSPSDSSSRYLENLDRELDRELEEKRLRIEAASWTQQPPESPVSRTLPPPRFRPRSPEQPSQDPAQTERSSKRPRVSPPPAANAQAQSRMLDVDSSEDRKPILPVASPESSKSRPEPPMVPPHPASSSTLQSSSVPPTSIAPVNSGSSSLAPTERIPSSQRLPSFARATPVAQPPPPLPPSIQPAPPGVSTAAVTKLQNGTMSPPALRTSVPQAPKLPPTSSQTATPAQTPTPAPNPASSRSTPIPASVPSTSLKPSRISLLARSALASSPHPRNSPHPSSSSFSPPPQTPLSLDSLQSFLYALDPSLEFLAETLREEGGIDSMEMLVNFCEFEPRTRIRLVVAASRRRKEKREDREGGEEGEGGEQEVTPEILETLELAIQECP